METITLHSNSRSFMTMAIEMLTRDRSCIKEVGECRRVSFSFGDRVTEDAARDFRFHAAIDILAGSWK